MSGWAEVYMYVYIQGVMGKLSKLYKNENNIWHLILPKLQGSLNKFPDFFRMGTFFW